MYEVIIHKRVNKFIDTLENSSIIRDKLKRLKDFKSNVRLGLDIARYKGKKNRFRIRIGEIRFIFEVIGTEIFIREANYRGKVY